MYKSRLYYIILIALTIILGLLSRSVSFVPLAVGDILYAVMMYWIVRFLFIHQTKILALVFAISFCFVIELLQLIDSPFFISIRSHPFLKLIFGQGFLWSDLLAYCVGGLIAWSLDNFFSKRNSKSLKFGK